MGKREVGRKSTCNLLVEVRFKKDVGEGEETGRKGGEAEGGSGGEAEREGANPGEGGAS